MSDTILNQRQKKILRLLQQDKKYALSDIQVFFPESDRPSPATLRRDVSELRDLGYLNHSGDRKSSRYTLSIAGRLYAPIDPHEYCRLDVDKRFGATSFDFSLFQKIPSKLFSGKEIDVMGNATAVFLKKSENASDIIKQKELERFVIELSWKSSKIEGNTYSLLDTERLIKEGIEAPGHTKDEAIMILNHKKAFQYVLEHGESHKSISKRFIEDIHCILVEGLNISSGLREKQVGITGSTYKPLSVPSQIREAIDDLCKTISKLKDPYSKAFIALIGISYIQPFEDGNKRTARLLANSILVAYNCAPLSYRNADEILYKEGTLVFYEKNSIIPMREIFVQQYLFACEQYLKF
ncbi:cell filamentation protein Fic [Candidatus Peregrinibacteria bacterium]|jgi:Fic family protein|nr:cell filamentation protein Fic [Candidatus Peregrinibacteria bacterium]